MNRLRQWLGLEMLSFPLQKNENGYLPAFHTESGDLRCPHCGGTDFGVRGQTTIHCHTCITTFSFYGKLGLKHEEA